MKPERTKEDRTALQIAVYAVNCSNTDEYIDEVARLIEEYKSQGKWVSVDERPPANNEWVWVCHPHRYGIKAMFVGQNKFGQMWRYDDDTMATFNKPTHWQPLPELPPIEETKEK